MGAIVKICGITSPEDAVAAVDAGADALGLMFYEKSVRNISLERGAEIARVISPGTLKVGVFVNASEEFVLDAIRTCDLNLLQFHGDESPEFCVQFPLMSLKAFRIRDAASLNALSDYTTHAWLLDAYSDKQLGGTGAGFDWNLAVTASRMGRPIFLAGGLNPGNVADAVRQVHPYGVDVSSGVESAPGKKDAAKMRAFVQAAKSVEY